MLRNIRNLFNRYTTELEFIEVGFKKGTPTTFCYIGEFPDARKFLSLVTLGEDDGFRAAVSVSESTDFDDSITNVKVMISYPELESYLESYLESTKGHTKGSTK